MKHLLLIILTTSLFSQSLRDGKYIDSGREMMAVSKFAPLETNRLLPLIGAWDVKEKLFRNDSVINVFTGHSEIKLNNRGNSFLERTYIYKRYRNTDEYTLSLFVNSKVNGKWGLGIVSAYKENVQVLDGYFEKDELILKNAVRYLGGMTVTLERLTYKISKDHFSYIFEHSTDYGKTWVKKLRREYQRVANSHKIFNSNDDYGKADPERLPEAAEFDFLIGEGKASHKRILRTGKTIKFPAKTSAVFVLNGKAIMEFNVVDVDKSLPDAATTIIRIYNSSMQRWENLFLNNRSNNLLNFGGRKVGDKIILTNFESNKMRGQMSRYVFYNVKDNSDYDWYSDLSFDGGKNYVRYWQIEIRKN